LRERLIDCWEVQLTPKSMVWRSAVATMIMIMLALSASSQTLDRGTAATRAQEQTECKPWLLAAGKTKYRPLTFARGRKGEGAAMADAVANWQRDANDRHGSQWMLWEKAEERSVMCAPSRSGTIRCMLEARPCSGGPDRV